MKFYEYVERMKDTPYTEDVEYSMKWGALLSRVNEWPVNVKSIGDSSEIIKIPRYHESERYKRYVPVKGYSGVAFKDMKKATDIIADGLFNRTITSESFSGCVNLKRITIPKSVTRIEENAFKDCDSLEDVYYEGTLEEWRKIDIVSGKYEVEFGDFYPGTPVQKIKSARLRHIPGNEALFRATIHFSCDLDELQPGWERELEEAERRKELRRQGSNVYSGLPTGFEELDHELDGLHKGELILVSARPGMGKTTFAMAMAGYVALEEKVPVLYLSMAEKKERAIALYLSHITGIDFEKVTSGDLTDEERRMIKNESDRIAGSVLHIEECVDADDCLVSEILSGCREMKRKYGVGLIVLDYFQLLHCESGSWEARRVDRCRSVKELRNLAQELDVPIVVISQHPRDCEYREDLRPSLRDFRHWGFPEQDWDAVLFLYRDHYYHRDEEDPGQMEIIIAGNRHGSLGTVYVEWRQYDTNNPLMFR